MPSTTALISYAKFLVNNIAHIQAKVEADYYVDPYVESSDGSIVTSTSMFDETPRAILLGQAGAGKTTLLRHRANSMARKFIKQKGRGRCPLFLDSHALSELANGASFPSVASKLVSSRSDGTIEPSDIERLLVNGSLELLLDGLDEILHPNRLRVAEIIGNVFIRYPKTTGTISSRPAALTVQLPGFGIFSLPGFNQAQLRRLIDKLAADEPEAGRSFYNTLLASRQLSDLATSPLLTRLLWQSYLYRQSLPSNPAALYSDFVDYLLSSWEQTKRLTPRSRVTLAEVVAFLERVALKLFTTSQISFAPREVEDYLRQVISDGEVSSAYLLDELVGSGLLVQYSDGLTFRHKSFAEYFAARAIANRPQQAVHLLDTEGGDELLVFACGLLDDTGPLIEAAIQRRRVIIAAKCISQGRTRNEQLKQFVVTEFIREVGRPFVELLTCSQQTTPDDNPRTEEPTGLLELLDGACDSRLPNHERGYKFESFASRFFSEVFKPAYRNLQTESGELDIVVEIVRTDPFWGDFGGDVLVECKNWASDIPIKEVGAFLNKVGQARVKLGFFVSMSGFTEDALRNLKNHASNPALPLVVPLTGESIRHALHTGAILEEYFKAEIRNMKFHRKY